MASYDSPAPEENATAQSLKKVEFRFCRECSNMLYPREDRETNQLIFQCRNCQWPTAVEPTCIYRNELSNTVGETSGVTQDVASDPTVGDPIPELCTLCGQEILCSTCGEPTDGGVYLEVEDMPDDEPTQEDVEEEKTERQQSRGN